MYYCVGVNLKMEKRFFQDKNSNNKGSRNPEMTNLLYYCLQLPKIAKEYFIINT